jgi:hypothetical protein
MIEYLLTITLTFEPLWTDYFTTFFYSYYS